jgi:hypothetical protein
VDLEGQYLEGVRDLAHVHLAFGGDEAAGPARERQSEVLGFTGEQPLDRDLTSAVERTQEIRRGHTLQRLGTHRGHGAHDSEVPDVLPELHQPRREHELVAQAEVPWRKVDELLFRRERIHADPPRGVVSAGGAGCMAERRDRERDERDERTCC